MRVDYTNRDSLKALAAEIRFKMHGRDVALFLATAIVEKIHYFEVNGISIDDTLAVIPADLRIPKMAQVFKDMERLSAGTDEVFYVSAVFNHFLDHIAFGRDQVDLRSAGGLNREEIMTLQAICAKFDIVFDLTPAPADDPSMIQESARGVPVFPSPGPN